jgi:hypothetical protein
MDFMTEDYGDHRVKIDAAASGDNQLIAAVAGKRIRILSMFFVAGGAVNAKYQSDSGGGAADLTGPLPLAANGGASLPFNRYGWLETQVGKKLNLNLSAAVQISGSITYALIG